ncbi:hypothetical protein ACTFR8_22175 [Bacillus cereus group sp. MYBK15-3]|uniref:hypothetical protein n=1 Tax=Bacillus cereus group TaxID=86661 RepID=UPI001C8BCD3E|nr:hypothetical protein [Bacillus cereus]MBX9158308.1 hypothetical protein [Bacillus cereus]
MSKDTVEEEWDAGIPIVIIITLLALLGGGYAFYDSRVQLKEKEAAVELALEEVRAANNWAASKTDKAETKVYEVKEYSKLEPSVLGRNDENINASTPQFKFVGVNKDGEVPTVYESTISYTNHKGELNSVTQNVYVVYTDEINKPELRVKEVKKDGSKYAKDVAVNPTLYLPNNK